MALRAPTGKCLGALAVLSVTVSGQQAVPAWTPRHEILGEHSQAALGSAVAVLNDVDGDGVPDVAIGAPESGPLPGPFPGRVLVVSGRDLAPLYSISGVGAGDRFGSALGAIDDQDGDGLTDWIVGAPQVEGPGYAEIRSGADGHVLLSVPTPGGAVSFGAAVGAAGDVNADGVLDVIVGDPGYLYDGYSGDSQGGLRVFSGADASILLTHIGDLPPLNLGRDVAAAGDVNGDGHGDVLACGLGHLDDHGFGGGKVVLLSGLDGSVLQTWSLGSPSLGAWVTGVGDFDGDGLPDVLTSGSTSARVLSGADGDLLLQIPEAGRVSTTGDLDGDGIGELIVGNALLSGADAAPIVELGGFESLAHPGDVDGDGRFDLIGVNWSDDTKGPWTGSATLVANPLVLLRQEWLGGAAAELAGWSVASPVDLDADGHGDVAFGAPGADAPATDAGAARAMSGADGSLLIELPGTDAGDETGRAVAAAGDVDGDGVGDLVVGAPGALAGGLATGTATVLSGRDGGVLRVFQGVAEGDRFGAAVSGAGDLDGDGRDDVIVGAFLEDAAVADAGVVRVYSGLDGQVLLGIAGTASGAQFGRAVSGAGDIDGDGVPDVAIGAPRDSTAGINAGRVRAYSGADSALLLDRQGEQAGDRFGSAVAFAGDLDLDGHDELLVGAPQTPFGPDGERGRAYVLSGANGAMLHAWTGGNDGAHLGTSVAAAGDMDGDRLAEVAIGAPGAQPVLLGGEPGGAVTVFDGASGTPLFTLSGPEASQFGYALAGGGDLDGNGLSDLVVGLPGADVAELDAGAVRVFGMASVIAPWVDLGGGLAGQAGLPILHAAGSPVPDGPLTLTLQKAAPTTAFMLVVGGAAANLPFKGGVLVPVPEVVLAGLDTNASGTATLDGRWPPAWPSGLQLFMQAWIIDLAGPLGFAASNGLQVVLP